MLAPDQPKLCEERLAMAADRPEAFMYGALAGSGS
jgi:hypothetical protein